MARCRRTPSTSPRVLRWLPSSSSPDCLYGPPAERGEIDPVSSGVLGGYLFGAFMLVLATAHALRADDVCSC